MSIIDYAKEYAEAGLRIFPVKRDKSPCTFNGNHDASNDLRQIDIWWDKFPDANIGILTGSGNGNIVVVDLDKDDNKGLDGYHELREWQRETGMTLPDTWTVMTGRGGMHMYYIMPQGVQVGNTVKFRDCIDIRGENGYVVAPPSIHENGNPYYWDTGPEDMENGPALANDAVFALIECCKENNKKQTADGEPKGKFVLPDTIPEGQRDDTIFREMCRKRGEGKEIDEITAWGLYINAERCKPPLSEAVIKQKAQHVCQTYAAGRVEVVGDRVVEPPKIADLKRDGKGKVIQSIGNALTMLEEDSRFKHRLYYDEQAHIAIVAAPMPWESQQGFHGHEWREFDDANLLAFAEREYCLKNEKAINNAKSVYLSHNGRHPLQEALMKCHDKYWDGKTGHVRKLLPHYLGAPDDSYTYEVMHVFLKGAVYRAFQPGCKFDYMMILAGDQGIGKSTFLRMTALSDKWFTDSLRSLDGNQAIETIRGMFIVEMGELLSMKKAKDVEAIKAFISTMSDDYRAPYAKNTEKRLRSCVFAGTTNAEQFLTDQTGNRRFLPVRCSARNIKQNVFDDERAIRDDVVQAYGEVIAECIRENWKADLRLPKYVEVEAVKQQEQSTEDDWRSGVIAEYVNNMAVGDRVCAIQLASETLNMQRERVGKKEITDIIQILSTIPTLYKEPKKKRCGDYGAQRVFTKIDGFTESEDEEPDPF